MAALRYAANRLVGRALLRRQTAPVVSQAVAEEQRRLLARFIHGGRPVPSPRSPSSYTHAGAAHTPNRNGEHPRPEPAAQPEHDKTKRNAIMAMRLRGIKEDMYGLLSEMDREGALDGHKGYEDKKLHEHLSKLVEPKPDDPDWRWARASRRFDDSNLRLRRIALLTLIINFL